MMKRSRTKCFYDIEIFSDAHPEYLEDDSDHKAEVTKPVETSHDKPAHNEPAHDDASEAAAIEGNVQQEWIFRLAIFGAVFTFIMWYVKRRRNDYDPVKQEEKYNV